jgi:hypothetical protein
MFGLGSRPADGNAVSGWLRLAMAFAPVSETFCFDAVVRIGVVLAQARAPFQKLAGRGNPHPDDVT